MGFPVYDYRTDIRNVLVTPQIRSRFLKMEPGQSAQLHSHDLGHEIFLILEGRVEFEIEGETEELGPGQMCVALADQPHTVRVLGDEPMTMYLSVTPHIHNRIFTRRIHRVQRVGNGYHTIFRHLALTMLIPMCRYRSRNSLLGRYTQHNCLKN